LWPGFGENARVLEWIVGRVEGSAAGLDTPIGVTPAPGALNTRGLDVSPATITELLRVDKAKWLREADNIAAYQKQFGDRLPAGIRTELAGLRERLNKAA
jgi:phosphoenolpyruvate carboxykinase (GTP)